MPHANFKISKFRPDFSKNQPHGIRKKRRIFQTQCNNSLAGCRKQRIIGKKDITVQVPVFQYEVPGFQCGGILLQRSEIFPVEHTDEHIEIQTEYREYYVGYFEEGRPVVIYFYYNGDDDISVSDESAKTYEKLDPQTKMDTLMHILYQIYIGSKEYIRCPWIDEVFTDIMVASLVQTFEGDIRFYKLDEEKNKNLVRRKPKDK